MTITRLLYQDGEDRPEQSPASVPLEDWLAYLESRRDVILMELRQIEPVLVRYNRLRAETPRRIR